MRWRGNVVAAFQVIAAQPVRTLLLALPVAASTALALATLAIDHGLTVKADEAARSFGTDVISVRAGARVIAGRSGAFSTLTEDDEKALRARLLGRRARAVEGTCIADKVETSSGSKKGYYRVFAVRPPWAQIRQFGAARGQFLDDHDARAHVCVIGQTVARELFGDEDPLGREVLLNEQVFKVKGVLVAKGASPAEGDRDARVVVPLEVWQRRKYQQQPLLDQVVVQAANSSPETLHRLEQQITAVLREQHKTAAGQPDDFSVRLPEKIAEESRGLSHSVFLLLLGLAAVCGFVAALLIALVSHQAVRARQGEIGIRRALGALPADILEQLWAEGLAVSLLGGLLGFGLGLAGAWGLAEWRQLAFGVDVLVLVVPLAIVVLASLAGLVPAWTAARLDPARALRPAA